MIWGFVQIEEFGNSVDKMMIDHVIFGYPIFKNKLMWDEKRDQSMMSSMIGMVMHHLSKDTMYTMFSLAELEGENLFLFVLFFSVAKMTIWLVWGVQKFQPAVGPKRFERVPKHPEVFFKHGSFDDLGSTPASYIRSVLPRSTHRRWVLRRRR